MYADREEAQANRSVKERLNGNSAAASGRRRPISGKRIVGLTKKPVEHDFLPWKKCLECHGIIYFLIPREMAPFVLPNSKFSCRQREDDDKWQHDLFEDNEPQVSNSRVGAKDLRLKLQRKSIEQATQNLRNGARDLRDKLSGTLYSRPNESQEPPLRPKPAPEASKPPRDGAIDEATGRGTKKIASTVSKKKPQQKVETVDSFLESLGLEKYSITFQAEEVDMTALVHMGDEDLKALGIPMGPRKKILLALELKV